MLAPSRINSDPDRPRPQLWPISGGIRFYPKSQGSHRICRGERLLMPGRHLLGAECMEQAMVSSGERQEVAMGTDYAPPPPMSCVALWNHCGAKHFEIFRPKDIPRFQVSELVSVAFLETFISQTVSVGAPEPKGTIFCADAPCLLEPGSLISQAFHLLPALVGELQRPESSLLACRGGLWASQSAVRSGRGRLLGVGPSGVRGRNWGV